MMEELVWAYKPLKELNGETGFVTCEAGLAAKLIESGDVQDPRVGGHHLREIEDAAEYETKVMTPKRKSTQKATKTDGE